MNDRLTSHQTDTLRRLAGRSARSHVGWVHERDCGSPGALAQLHREGYAERKVEVGPRGGEHVFYRPTEKGRAKVNS